MGLRVLSDSRGFTQTCIGVTEFFRDYLGSFWCAKWSPGSFVFAWVHSDTRIFRRGHHYCSQGFTRARLMVAGLIKDRVGSLRYALLSPGSFEFA